MDVSKLSVLLVIHGRTERLMHAALLRSIGVETIEECTNVPAGLAKIRDHHIDAVIVDERLPSGDIPHFPRMVHEQRTEDDVPTAVILSAMRPTADRIRAAIGAGYVTVLAKPFAPRDLVRYVMHAVARARPAVSGSSEPESGNDNDDVFLI